MKACSLGVQDQPWVWARIFEGYVICHQRAPSGEHMNEKRKISATGGAVRAYTIWVYTMGHSLWGMFMIWTIFTNKPFAFLNQNHKHMFDSNFIPLNSEVWILKFWFHHKIRHHKSVLGSLCLQKNGFVLSHFWFD